jgi:hypothetical protein
MKQLLCVLFVFAAGTSVLAQESETTTVRTTTTVIVEEQPDLLFPLWSMTDAVPIEPCSVDLRANFAWETNDGDVTLGDNDDDFILTPAVVWGIAEDWEVWARTPAWLGDAGNRGPFEDGNYDTYLGFLYRFKDQEGNWPAMALAGEARIPTGDGSEGVDGELRLVMTNDYESGLRSHINLFGATLNGSNEDTLVGDEDEGFLDFAGPTEVNRRKCLWGLVVGLDGPLSEGGDVRWVADYVFRSSTYEGNNNVHLAEVGLQWKIDDDNALGLSGLFGIHNEEETPDFGAGVTYSYTLRY